jgi:hypothetical protein
LGKYLTGGSGGLDLSRSGVFCEKGRQVSRRANRARGQSSHHNGRGKPASGRGNHGERLQGRQGTATDLLDLDRDFPHHDLQGTPTGLSGKRAEQPASNAVQGRAEEARAAKGVGRGGGGGNLLHLLGDLLDHDLQKNSVSAGAEGAAAAFWTGCRLVMAKRDCSELD